MASHKNQANRLTDADLTGEDSLSPLTPSPIRSRHQLDPATASAPEIMSSSLRNSLRKVSWHSSTSQTSPSIDRRQQQAEPSNQPATPAAPATAAAFAELESSEDETTAILRRVRGGDRNYNTQGNGRATGSDASLARANSRSSRESNGADETADPAHDPGVSWWKKTLAKYGSVELENKGSVARDHLALERTFLAWLRTSLSFASIGIAVTQLFRLNTSISHGEQPTPGQLRLRQLGKPLGATFLAIGIATLLIGFHRYFESQHYVILGKFPASRGSIVLMVLMTSALIIASFVVILSIAPSAVVPRFLQLA